MTSNSNSISRGEKSISAISNLEIWKTKTKNNLSSSSAKNVEFENGKNLNQKEIDEENLDEELLDENLSQSKDKQIKKLTEPSFKYNQVPSNKPIVRDNLKVNKENDKNFNNANIKPKQISPPINGTNNTNINLNPNNGVNEINNVFYQQNRINLVPQINYMMSNYNNINISEIKGEMPDNIMNNVGEKMNYIPLMHPQMINMNGFIPQIQNNMVQMNTLNQLNNMTIANNAMNIQIINNNIVNKKSKYNNIYNTSNVNNTVNMNPYMQNKMYNNKNMNNNKINEKEKQKQKVDIIEIISGKDRRTTLMLRNIPNKYKLNDLVKEIDKSFWGKYDYINLPIDYERKTNLGYAFINFVEPLHIILFYETYHNKRWLLYKSDKKMDMAYADKQGKKDINCKDEQTYYAQHDTRFHFKSLNPKIQIPMKYLEYFKKIYPKSVCIEEKCPIYQNQCFQVLNLGKK